MASDLLHILTLERVIRDPALPPAIGALLRRQHRFAQLGAVLVDLPYFEDFLARVLDDLRGRDDRPSTWGDRLHRHGALALAQALLLEAQDSPVQEQLVAIALGHLTHVRLDLETHPRVNQLVAQAGPVPRPGALHRTIESVQVELWHRAQHGRRLFGAPQAYRLLAHDAALLGTGAVGEAVARAFGRTFGAAPSPSTWRRFGRGLRLYALAVAGPAGWLHLSARTLREGKRWMGDDRTGFVTVVDRAVAAMVRDVADAYALAPSLGRQPNRFEARFPERDLDCLEQPVLPRPAVVQRAARALAASTTYL